MNTFMRFATGVMAAFFVPGFASRPVFATSWMPPSQAGVAAVDPQTGAVLWEAWRPEEVPIAAGKPAAEASRRLTADAEDYESGAWQSSRFPAALGDGLVADVSWADKKLILKLSDGRPDAIGVEVARATLDTDRGYAVVGSDAFYHVFKSKLHAYPAIRPGGPPPQEWKPAWTFDLIAGVPLPPVPPHLAASPVLLPDARGIWVVAGPRVVHVRSPGKADVDFVVKNPWPPYSGDFEPTISLGQRWLYFHQGRGVIALDPETGKEAWRLATSRSPYPSRVVVVPGGPTLVQVGSDTPLTLMAAMGIGWMKLPKLGPDGPQKAAAAAEFLHAYGDPSERPRLRAQADRLWQTQAAADAGETAAAAGLDRLQATWPPFRDRRRLLDATIAVLLGRNDGPLGNYVPPDTRRLVAWCLLQELIYGRTPDGYNRPGSNFAYDFSNELPVTLAPKVAAELADHCREVLSSGPAAERPFAASVLVSKSLGWDRTTADERRRLFLSDEPAVWRWTGIRLVKEGFRREMIRWGTDRPAHDHPDILWMLLHDMPKPWPAEEQAFWLKCLRQSPGPVVSVLDRVKTLNGID
ncbi:MAG: hypothetical protein ACRC7O_17830, partial [Fimbriiglobus sp.]